MIVLCVVCCVVSALPRVRLTVCDRLRWVRSIELDAPAHPIPTILLPRVPCFFERPFPLLFVSRNSELSLNKAGYTVCGQSRTGGQGPYSRSLDHLGRCSEKRNEIINKIKTWPTNQPTDRPTDKAGSRVARTRLKSIHQLLILVPHSFQSLLTSAQPTFPNHSSVRLSVFIFFYFYFFPSGAGEYFPDPLWINSP